MPMQQSSDKGGRASGPTLRPLTHMKIFRLMTSKTMRILPLLAILLLSACGGGGSDSANSAASGIILNGSVGDGPIAGAKVSFKDRNGLLIATVTSGDNANYRVELPIDTAFPVLITASGGTDLVSGGAPDFIMYSAVLDEKGTTANINPFSTLMVQMALGMPGGLSADNLQTARDIVTDQLGFGLDTRLMPDPIASPVTPASAANVIKSSEALAEMIRRTQQILQDAGQNMDEDQLIIALAGDLRDRRLDGIGPGAERRIAASASLVSARVLVESLSNTLEVNNTPARDALDAAIRRAEPKAGKTSAEVAITAQMLTQSMRTIQASLAASPGDGGLSALASALEGISADAMPGDAPLPAGAAASIDLAIASLATASDMELAGIIDAMTLANSNAPPTISGTPATAVTVGNSYLFTPTAADPEGNSLVFSIANKPAWLNFDSTNGTLSGTPTTGDAGRYANIVISVSDGNALTPLPAFEIIVDSGTATAPLTISNLSIPAYQWGNLATGQPVFVDRGFTYTGVPATYQGMKVLRTANNDKGATGNAFLSFDMDQAATVYIAYDTRIPQLPAWLTGWTATGDQITDSDTSRAIYKADFPAGTVTLGGNEGSAYSMYTVLVSNGASGGGNTGNSNTAPTISGIPAVDAVVGAAYSFTPAAADANGDTLTFSISNKPTWASFDTATGTLNGTPGSADVGMTSGIIISVSDGSLTRSLPAFDITVNDIANGVATISWTPPLTNIDGSTLTDLAGYKIRHGTSAGSYPNVINIANPGISSYVVNNLARGVHYFVVTAYDTSGNESAYSNVASKTIP